MFSFAKPVLLKLIVNFGREIKLIVGWQWWHNTDCQGMRTITQKKLRKNDPTSGF